jgi:glutathione peroxidase
MREMTKTLQFVALVLTLAGGIGVSPAAAQVASGGGEAATRSAACPALLDLSLPRLQDDVPQRLCRFAGQVILVVNTASRCGYTRQYEGLEKLHQRYRERGFTVLGFPSNEFGRQEPEDNARIAEFCFNTYGVRFPMFGKSVVSGPGANPLFATLAREAGAPQWNFHKYLIGRDGRVIGGYGSAIDPLDRTLLRAIEAALQAAPGGQRQRGATAPEGRAPAAAHPLARGTVAPTDTENRLNGHFMTFELNFTSASAEKATS